MPPCFLGYDLLAQRWVPYAYLYPFAELLAGVLMVAHALDWVSIPVALLIGSVGAVSVFYAVYVQKRELKCACVGGQFQCAAGFCLSHREPDDGGDGRVDAGAPFLITRRSTHAGRYL